MKQTVYAFLFFLIFKNIVLSATLITFNYGNRDFFDLSNGSEAAFASDNLKGYLTNLRGSESFTTSLDDNSINLGRIATFNFSDYKGQIIGANIQAYIRPFMNGNTSEISTYNDTLEIFKVGSYNTSIQSYTSLYSNSYVINLGNTAQNSVNSYFDFAWEEDSPNVAPYLSTGLSASIDLTNFNPSLVINWDDPLQPNSLGPTVGINLLDELNEIGSLDLYLSDDTTWDYIELNLILSPATEDSYVNEAYIPLPIESPRYYKNNGISYLLFNGNAKILDCDESLSGDVIIPRFINDFEVNCILSKAFKDCGLIESISLPSNDFFIEDLAFENCTALNYIYFPAGLPSEYINEEFLDNLYAANYADEILDVLSANDFSLQALKDDLLVAFNEWYNLFDSNPLNNLAPHNGDDDQPVFIDQDNNGLNDDMIDYFVDEFLDLSGTETTLEKYYELAKFSGRVMDFLGRSHGTYGESYSYRWGNSAPNNGRSLKDHLFDVLRGKEGVGGPQNQASKQIFDLDRYIDVSTYRSELNNFSNSSELNADTSDYHEIGAPGTFTNARLGQLSNPLAANNPYLVDVLIDAADFSLETDGEKLIYDSIANWLIQGDSGTNREMIALPGVEIWNPSDLYSIDGFVNVDDPDEVDLQKRAIAKRIYAILVSDINNPNSDQEFWDATLRVSDFFKYELHQSYDYSWMWIDYIQRELLLKIDAVFEDASYLTSSSNVLDFDGDGIRDLGFAKYPINGTYKNNASFYKELGDVIKENYPAANSDGSIRTVAYDNGYLPTEIYDYEIFIDREGEPIRDSETGLPFFKERILADKFLPVALKDLADWRIWYLPESATHQMINPFLFINDTFEIRVNNNYDSVPEYKGIPVTSSSSVSYIYNIVDSDLDGVSDNLDAFPGDPTETVDTDGDGVGDNVDEFPTITTQDVINAIIGNPSLYNLYSIQNMQDLRPGSTMIEVSGNQATVQLQMEESSDLETWENTGTSATMTIPADTDTKFFRIKMAE